MYCPKSPPRSDVSNAIEQAHTRPNTGGIIMRYRYAFAARSPLYEGSDPNGIRTRVTAVKGRCPGPLDDRVIWHPWDGQYPNCHCFTQEKWAIRFGLRG